jgi:hypothetical protein
MLNFSHFEGNIRLVARYWMPNFERFWTDDKGEKAFVLKETKLLAHTVALYHLSIRHAVDADR